MSVCDSCGRSGRGEPIGTTCGEPKPKGYRPLTDEEYAEWLAAYRFGWELPLSHPAVVGRERCTGTLLPVNG